MKTKIFLFAISLLVSLPSFAADALHVSSSVFTNGELVESPVMIVEEGKMAYMTVGDDFRYELTVSPKQGETVEVNTTIKVGEESINPSLTLLYDKKAAVEIGETKLVVLVNKPERQ